MKNHTGATEKLLKMEHNQIMSDSGCNDQVIKTYRLMLLITRRRSKSSSEWMWMFTSYHVTVSFIRIPSKHRTESVMMVNVSHDPLLGQLWVSSGTLTGHMRVLKYPQSQTVGMCERESLSLVTVGMQSTKRSLVSTVHILEKLHNCMFFDEEILTSMFFPTLHDAMLHVLGTHKEDKSTSWAVSRNSSCCIHDSL